ncbi:hypothetical protein VB264_23665 [Arcicella aquatica]|uniref:Uncharacterized protein n=1 Tax=Arcicella aquatica TaxID=217141 RepID=A0ABU5QUN7_9BACT|nr:hypothetical protein [Arcicella aquatica]MEA5260818.1 hypothetical protein [Arcicella aquatica]
MAKVFQNFIKTIPTQIWAFLRNEYKTFFVGILTTVTFLLSPVKQILFHWIWNEEGSVELIVPESNILYGKPFTVDVIIFPKSSLPVSQGVLTLIYKQSAFDTKGNTVFDTPEIEQVIHPADLKNTTFIPIRSGSYKLIAQLKTKHGVYSDTATLNVAYSLTQPTTKNWSGKWDLVLGDAIGSMNLVDIKEGGGQANLVGTFIVGNEHGVVSGFHDGTMFFADFISQNRLKKWHSETPHHSDGHSIKIDGNAVLSRTDKNSWKVVLRDRFFAYTSLN